MKIFDKFCLVVGKVLVFIVAFLSCFRMTELLYVTSEPYINYTRDWLKNNYNLAVIISFSLCIFIGLLIYFFSEERYKTIFRKREKITLEEETECIDSDAE